MPHKNPWTSWQKRDLHESVPSSTKKETIEMELLKEQVRRMRLENSRLEVELRAVVDDKSFAAERREVELALLWEKVRSLKIFNDFQEKAIRNKKG
jgi:hypothetical protein